jgi:hypothetical protein
MTETAREIVRLVPVTTKAWPVGAATGSSHAVAADAELLARATVTARA